MPSDNFSVAVSLTYKLYFIMTIMNETASIIKGDDDDVIVKNLYSVTSREPNP